MNGKIIIACVLLSAITIKVDGQSSGSLKQKKEAIFKEIERLKNLRDKTDHKKRVSVNQISLLNTQISLREEKIKIINAEIELLNSKISSNKGEIKSLQAKFGQLKSEYASMLRSTHQKRNTFNSCLFVFTASNFNEAYKRISYIKQINQLRKKKATEIQITQQDINTELTILDKNKKEKDNLLLDKIVEKQSLGKDRAQQIHMLEELTQKEQNLKKQLTQKQKEAQELNKAIQIAIRKEILAEQKRLAEAAKLAEAKAKAAEYARIAKEKAAKQIALAEAKKKFKTQPLVSEKIATNTSIPSRVITPAKTDASTILSANPEALKLSNNFLENKGKLPNPVHGLVTERFGTRVYKNVTINNPGITIKTNLNAPVHAVFNGSVSNVIFLINSYTIIIRHGEYFSIYTKLKNTTVVPGQKVNTGQHIGNVYTSITENTSEFGFQIWKGSSPINPSLWVSR